MCPTIPCMNASLNSTCLASRYLDVCLWAKLQLAHCIWSYIYWTMHGMHALRPTSPRWLCLAGAAAGSSSSSSFPTRAAFMSTQAWIVNMHDHPHCFQAPNTLVGTMQPDFMSCLTCSTCMIILIALRHQTQWLAKGRLIDMQISTACMHQVFTRYKTEELLGNKDKGSHSAWLLNECCVCMHKKARRIQSCPHNWGGLICRPEASSCNLKLSSWFTKGLPGMQGSVWEGSRECNMSHMHATYHACVIWGIQRQRSKGKGKDKDEQKGLPCKWTCPFPDLSQSPHSFQYIKHLILTSFLPPPPKEVSITISSTPHASLPPTQKHNPIQYSSDVSPLKVLTKIFGAMHTFPLVGRCTHILYVCMITSICHIFYVLALGK